MIKKLSFLTLFTLLSYIIFYDIVFGTFKDVSNHPPSEITTEVAISFQNIEIKSGDTLLSVVEQISTSNNIPSSDIIIKDFQTLNHGTQPLHLQIGTTYKIPIYK